MKKSANVKNSRGKFGGETRARHYEQMNISRTHERTNERKNDMVNFYVKILFSSPFPRVSELQSVPKEELESSPDIKPWQSRSDSNLDRASHDSIPLQSRDPDGASSEEYPAVSEENRDDVEARDDVLLSSGEDTDFKDARGKKRKRQRGLLACLSPARLSFRRKSERASQSKPDTTKLVKEI